MTPRFVLIRRLLAGFALAAATASATLAATPCTTKPGTDGTLIEARVLTPGGMLAKGLVLIGADGQIACVGSSCAARAPRAAVIRCPRAVLSPGFIHDHEHLDFAGDAPKPDDGVRYGQRQDWRKGLRGKPMQTYVPSRDRDLLSWGELRHLLSGTTSMIGEAYAPGLVRNLDFQAGLEGLDTPRASYAVFPLDDGAGTQRDGDCNYGPNPINEGQASALHALVAHVAEGRDAVARNEFYCISSMMFDTAPAPGGGGTSHDILYSNLAIVHGAALTPEMVRFCDGVRRKSPAWISAISRRALFMGHPATSLMRPLKMWSP